METTVTRPDEKFRIYIPAIRDTFGDGAEITALNQEETRFNVVTRLEDEELGLTYREVNLKIEATSDDYETYSLLPEKGGIKNINTTQLRPDESGSILHMPNLVQLFSVDEVLFYKPKDGDQAGSNFFQFNRRNGQTSIHMGNGLLRSRDILTLEHEHEHAISAHNDRYPKTEQDNLKKIMTGTARDIMQLAQEFDKTNETEKLDDLLNVVRNPEDFPHYALSLLKYIGIEKFNWMDVYVNQGIRFQPVNTARKVSNWMRTNLESYTRFANSILGKELFLIKEPEVFSDIAIIEFDPQREIIDTQFQF